MFVIALLTSSGIFLPEAVAPGTFCGQEFAMIGKERTGSLKFFKDSRPQTLFKPG
jgi:hypothetical protein